MINLHGASWKNSWVCPATEEPMWGFTN